MKSSASDSKPFQSRSKGEIPSQAWRKEQLSCVKLNQAFLIDSWRRTNHVLYSMYQVRLMKTFGVMIRFDNVLSANVLVSSDPNTKSVEFLYGRCRVDTCFTLICTFYYRSLFFFFFFGYSNLLLVRLRLKHRGNVFFSVRMIEKNTLQGRSVVIRLRQKCQYF